MTNELSIAEAAELTGYSAQHLRALALKGKVKARKVGVRVWVINARSLASWCKNHRPDRSKETQ